jgi:hypothetical protein
MLFKSIECMLRITEAIITLGEFEVLKDVEIVLRFFLILTLSSWIRSFVKLNMHFPFMRLGLFLRSSPLWLNWFIFLEHLGARVLLGVDRFIFME